MIAMKALAGFAKDTYTRELDKSISFEIPSLQFVTPFKINDSNRYERNSVDVSLKQIFIYSGASLIPPSEIRTLCQGDFKIFLVVHLWNYDILLSKKLICYVYGIACKLNNISCETFLYLLPLGTKCS